MDQPRPTTLDYHSGRNWPPAPITSVGLTFALAGILGSLHVVLLVFFPTIEAIYRDFKLELPGYTLVCLALARGFLSGGWIIPWLMVLLLPVLVVRLAFRVRPPERARRWIAHANWIVPFLTLLLGIGLLVALLAPMITLVTSISTP